MKIRLQLYAISVLATTFMFFTPLRDGFDEIKKDKNCLQIQESVSLINSKLKGGIKKLGHEELKEFIQKFQNNVSNSNVSEKDLFFRAYFKDFDLIKAEASKILSSIKKLGNTNENFKKLNETQRNEFFTEVLQPKNYAECSIGLGGGTSGCANWAYMLSQQGYPQSYIETQFNDCMFFLYVSYYICEANGGFWPS